ncbi:MAG: ABC transporter ATP-binding protein [Sphingobacteriales bacterium]|jgi:ATP-binding cassette subfamily B multidrug efflux pump
MERKRIFDFSQLKRVFRYATPYKNRFVLSIVLAIVLAVLAPVRPLLVQHTINNIIAKGLVNALVWITVIQIGILIVETLLRFVFSFITTWLGQTVVKDLRVEVFGKIIRLNLSQFDKTPIGTLTTRTINDIESINDIFSEGLIPLVADFLSIIAILIAMFWTNWQLTLVCLIPFPILMVATYFFKESVNKSFIRVRNAVAALNAFVQEHITGMAIVQSFAVEDKEAEKFREINKEHRNANINAIFAYSVFFPIVEIILATSMGFLVWYAGVQVMNLSNEEGVKIAGQIVSFIIMLNLLFRPLRVIADKFNVLQMGMVASERVFKVLDNPDFTEDKGSYRPARINGDLQFRQVSFGYDEKRDVLRDISFHIRQGETLAIVGHTGSGKTSIISLINRLYQVKKGEILIDGVDINAYALDALRSGIGVVLQDVFLFSGSIMDNVTLRNPDIPKEEVVRAAKMIGMHDFIMRLPGGYDYNVMERGGTLSMGQRQLLSFIRALLYNPSILILDEATSSVDTESELLIQGAIDKLITGRTSIIIAHRLSTIRKADMIMVLDKGEIREMGNHDDLLAQNGHYAGLHKMQFGELVRS